MKNFTTKRKVQMKIQYLIFLNSFGFPSLSLELLLFCEEGLREGNI